MCESTAYILRDNKQELVLENVDILEETNGHVRMVDIFGEEMTINARVRTLSLIDHRITLEPS